MAGVTSTSLSAGPTEPHEHGQETGSINRISPKPWKGMMSDNRKKLGRWGENLAQIHLQAKGFRIVAQNWRCQWGEMDIIAEDTDTLVFVEVKTRRGRDLGTPEEAITTHKARKLYHIAQTYLAEQEKGDIPWRIDLVAVELDKQGKLLRCEHRPNILDFGFTVYD